MKPVDKEILKIAANNLMFDMTDEQYDTLLEEFSIISKQMELVNGINGVNEATPMTFPYDLHTAFLREDETTKPLEKSEALKNASDVVDNYIRLPKVVK